MSNAVRDGSTISARVLAIFFPANSYIVHLRRNLIKPTIAWKLAESEAQRQQY
jgi:hypothetical protein